MDEPVRDGCQFCLGAKGGVPGNENRVGNVVMCDYCSTLYMVAAEQERLAEKFLRNAASKSNEDICQTLGKALGYPWFKDDQKNFPGATEADGVCVGDHVAESIADEAARRITELRARITELEIAELEDRDNDFRDQ